MKKAEHSKILHHIEFHFLLHWNFRVVTTPIISFFCGFTFAYIFHSHFTPVCILYGTLYSKHRLHSILHAVTSSGITRHLTDGKSGITRSNLEFQSKYNDIAQFIKTFWIQNWRSLFKTRNLANIIRDNHNQLTNHAI